MPHNFREHAACFACLFAVTFLVPTIYLFTI